MTLSDIVLKKGQIMLKQTSLESVYIDNSSCIYGSIEKVSDLSDMFSDWSTVPQTVMFVPGQSISITVDNERYYLTTEDNIYLTFINI